MPAFVSAGGSVSWNGISLRPRSITYTSAEAETVTLPVLTTPKNSTPLVVPTGDNQGGSISVEYTRELLGVNMDSYVGASASFSYTDSNGYSIVVSNMLLTSCSENVGTGDVVTGTLEFVLTSFSGNNWS